MDYPILSDAEKKVAAKYGVVSASRPFPQRWTFYIGTDGKILHIDKGVKAGSHGTDIATKLKELEVDEKTEEDESGGDDSEEGGEDATD